MTTSLNFGPATNPQPNTQSLNAAFDTTGNVPILLTKAQNLVGLPLIYAQTNVPVYIPSSGSMGANGAVTITTALPETFSSGVFLRFPAGAVFSGSQAGVYFAVMTSGTAGTVYNNQLVSGLPVIPSSLVPVVDPGPGAYTQVTATLLQLISLTLPPNAMGPGGIVEVTQDAAWINNANSKTFNMVFGTQTLLSVNHTTNQTMVQQKKIGNRGLTNSQVTMPTGTDAFGVTGSGAPAQLAQDTTQPVTMLWQGNLVTAATDWMGWDSIRLIVYPSN